MGQGQTKASKRRESNGEQGPSPKKEAKKSPKKSRGSKGSSSTSRSPSSESQLKGQMQIEEREASPTRRLGPSSQSQGVNGEQNGVEDVKTILSKSPPKPKRTYEVEFIEPEKENVPDGMDELDVSEIRKVESSPTKTSFKMNGEHEPFTPVKASDLNHVPQATSTPAPNGILSTGTARQLSSGRYSDDDHTDVSDDEAYASEQQFRSSSPTASNVSLKSFSTINSSSLRTKSDSSYEKKVEVNYGKFYNQSYLNKGSQNYMTRGRTLSEPKIKNNVNQFIRPANFSYSKEPPSFLKNKKAQGKTVVKTRRSSSPGPSSSTATGVRKNTEAVRMSMWPGGKRPPPKEIAKIERDDWPAPPSPAAILPEILRQRRKSRGEEDDDDEPIVEDPKIKREIEELRKFKDESGIGKVIYNELEVAKQQPLKALDPWKSSRVPNAAYEPKYQTRYQSPMFASPSRFLDRTKRSWDDCDIRAGYRTIAIHGHIPAPKPGYGLAPRAATLPVSGMYGGPLDLDYRVYDLDVSSGRDTRVSTSSINTETSKVTSTIFDQPGVSLMTFQKSSWHTDTKPPVYNYERLKISNFDLPKDVDRDQLEIHLPKEEFEGIFNMSVEEFRHLPEWKRNDMKMKKDLY
ncbi:actin-binding LIM protein 1-like isoform X2 [Ruditapes philippinarum]|uniref:actin-binding LIM protein 1-like isoform X2 n=1 Tax=Ruditapes philippinarum TaxID=129788 RepID=UPI00295B0F0A|nr:actin-binding LIM protein 1-like isoform X2 [Ruditapes philippinarum]